MALTFGFYNSVDGDRKYDAIQFGRIFDGIIKDGIYATYEKGMVVKASSNPSEVIIQPGRAWFNHTWNYNDADFIIEAPAPETLLDRIDALVLDVNEEMSSRTNSFMWVQGIPSSTPQRPALENSITHHQYPLCYVRRYPETTMIYARDITNMVGTSECPFATGVLEGINLDSWVKQWDDEFHDWEDNSKAAFEVWMLNQKSVYTSWFNSVRDQMGADLNEFEAWVDSIRDIIDENAATHLQSEIDEIRTMLPAGSCITITTFNTELFNRNVTIRDTKGRSSISKFDSNGTAVIKTFPYVGQLVITSTDGIQTATRVVNVPYYGDYTFPIAFWAADVNLQGDDNLKGVMVTIKDSDNLTVDTVTLSLSDASGVFTATKADTYSFIFSYEENEYVVQLDVTKETTYSIRLSAGIDIEKWLTAGGVNPTSYSSLSDVLADEALVRRLMTVHAAVDYLASAQYVNTDLKTIINNDICAKWINLRDYALDTLYANPAIAAAMDEADKYFYGEWGLMPQVPAMASNTTPYGEVSTSESVANAYIAFDDRSYLSTGVSLAQAANGSSITYKFTNPICIKAFEYSGHGADTATTYYVDFTAKIEVSNDGSNWTEIYEHTWTKEEHIATFRNPQFYRIENPNNVSARYVRFRTTSNNYSYANLTVIGKLQFYAWGAKGAVPAMTSNAAPYGEAFAKDTSAGYLPCYAFDRLYTTSWISGTNDGSGNWVGYKFTNPILVTKATITPMEYSGQPRVKNYKIQASNDNVTWTDLYSGVFNDTQTQNISITNNKYYLYYRLFCVDIQGPNIAFGIWSLQFYGRSLNVSVPAMTSNTTPYGEAKASSVYNTNYDAWKAFTGVDTTASFWHSQLDTAEHAHWLMYKFTKPFIIKMFKTRYAQLTARAWRDAYLQGSNDGTSWKNLYGPFSISDTSIHAYWVNNNNPYQYYRILNGTTEDGYANISTTDFFGIDYSEREFEPGTTKKWLYDHGVEVEPFRYQYARNNGNKITLEQTGASGPYAATVSSIDLEPFNNLRLKIGDSNGGGSSYLIVVDNPRPIYNSSTWATYKLITNGENPNTESVPVNAITQKYHCAVSSIYLTELTEMWLE